MSRAWYCTVSIAACLYTSATCSQTLAETEISMPDISSGSAASPNDFLADSILTCDEMRKHAALLFDGGGVDLGGGLHAPVDVDYGCPEGLGSLPFMQKFHALTLAVRGAKPCGTVYAALDRHFLYDLLQAGFAPERMIEEQAEWAESLAAGSSDAQWKRPTTYEYLESWSYESLYNFKLYQAYMREIRAVRPLLTKHYEKKFKYSREQAALMAQGGIELFLDYAAGSFSSSLWPEIHKTLELAQLGRESTAAFESWTSEADIEDVRMTLRIALLLERSRDVIRVLTERVGGLDYGIESPLFFALENRGNVNYLLSKGADINYQNKFGKTALFYAIQFNDHSLARFLISRGADVNHRYRNDQWEMCTPYQITHAARTTLMHAAQHADVAMLKLLLRNGARMDGVDGVGDNALAYSLRAEADSMPSSRPSAEAYELRGGNYSSSNDPSANSAFLKKLGLPAPAWEVDLRYRKLYRACSDSASRQELEGDALNQFMTSCLKEEPVTSN